LHLGFGNWKCHFQRIKKTSTARYVDWWLWAQAYILKTSRYVRGALEETKWRETEQTKRFSGQSKHGRHVFALTRNNAICVTTIQVGMVPGVEPNKGALEDGTIYLGSLRPHQREWWVAVDCFHF
jgi:hypothetical protein